MSSRVLTIADLVQTASLETSVLAGAGGLAREVLWAHSCEMTDPAQWLGPHELLMTVGLCVPHDPDDQVAFVAALDESGLAGMMIGDHDPAPPLSAPMLAEADRREFPVLLAGPRTPYAVVARHVAAAHSSEQTLQVLKLSKLYHLAAVADQDAAALVRDLAALLEISIGVLDASTGLTLLSSRSPDAAAPGAEPAAPTSAARRYALRGTDGVELVIGEPAGEELDSFLLVHLMKVLEVAVARLTGAAERRAEASSRLLLALLNGAPSPQTGAFLRPHLASEGFRLLAVPAEQGAALSRAVALQELPVPVAPGRAGHLALVPEAALAAARRLVTSVAAHVGVSSVFTDLSDTRAAAAEAGKVLAAAQHSGRRWVEFEGSTVSVLTRSLREASEVVQGVLGPLAEDSDRTAVLRETLFAYLRNDRSWKQTAAELSVHRQTLAYRLGRITEETGLSMTRTADLSALWIAYQAWEVVHGPRSS